MKHLLVAGKLYEPLSIRARPPLIERPMTATEMEWVNRWNRWRKLISDEQVALFRMLREPDTSVDAPNGTTVALVWIKEHGPGGTVINGETGAVYFDGKRVAENFAEAMALFRKRVNRIEYGVDPPAELYEERKRADRNLRRKATRSRQKSVGAKPPVSVEPSQVVAVGEKPAASPAEEKDFMEMIRDMVARG